MLEKRKDFVSEILKKYGFNPVVETHGALNHVSLKRSAELNKDELSYLESLSKKEEKKKETPGK